jgi:hypothetical protein
MCKKHKRYQGILKPRGAEGTESCAGCADYYWRVGIVAAIVRTISFGRRTERWTRLTADSLLRKVSR